MYIHILLLLRSFQTRACEVSTSQTNGHAAKKAYQVHFFVFFYFVDELYIWRRVLSSMSISSLPLLLPLSALKTFHMSI